VRTAAARTAQRVDAYTLELQRHGLESVQREVRWLTELIDTERAGGQPAFGPVKPVNDIPNTENTTDHKNTES
jgi:hypothetical protein